MSALTPQIIEAMIFTIDGHTVMLDSDLAKLYGVETKVLNQAVKRALNRFPADFSFIPNSEQLTSLRSQIVTLGHLSSDNYFRHAPRLFTENGVAMLSSVLRSDRAIEVNISIMRTFTKLRSFLSLESSNSNKIDELGQNTNKLFKIVFERLDSIDDKVTPKLARNRKKIGLNPKTNK